MFTPALAPGRSLKATKKTAQSHKSPSREVSPMTRHRILQAERVIEDLNEQCKKTKARKQKVDLKKNTETLELKREVLNESSKKKPINFKLYKEDDL